MSAPAFPVSVGRKPLLTASSKFCLVLQISCSSSVRTLPKMLLSNQSFDCARNGQLYFVTSTLNCWSIIQMLAPKDCHWPTSETHVDHALAFAAALIVLLVSLF